MISRLHAIRLIREDTSIPWGFRLEGGIDIGHPVNIRRVNPGGVAEQSGLCVGDVVVRINRSETRGMRHEEAKMEIIRSCNDLEMLIERGSGATLGHSTTATPQKSGWENVQKAESSTSNWQPRIYSVNQSPGSPMINTRISLEASPNERSQQTIGVQHNISPTPFGRAPIDPGQSLVTKSSDGRLRQISHSNYNSPKGLYAKNHVDETFERTMHAAKVGGDSARDNSRPGLSGAPAAPDVSAKFCGSCGEFIRGVFVKIQGRIPMHPECLKCCKCNVGLRNIGYFYINESLYCETHAKQAAPPPQPGMKPVVVYK